MFACLQNKRKNAVKFLILISRIVLGVIYVPLLSLLPLDFREKFCCRIFGRCYKKCCVIVRHSYIVSRKFVVQTHGCENLISLFKIALEMNILSNHISFDQPKEKGKEKYWSDEKDNRRNKCGRFWWWVMKRFFHEFEFT